MVVCDALTQQHKGALLLTQGQPGQLMKAWCHDSIAVILGHVQFGIKLMVNKLEF
jgi:hypothetical protein